MAERLLDHDATPELELPVLVLALIGELRLAELFDRDAKEPIGDCEVEDGIALCPMGLFRVTQCATNLLVQLGFGKIALDVGHFIREPLPRRLVDPIDVELRGRIPDEGFQHVVEMVAPALRRPLGQVDADQRKFLWQNLGTREVVESRYQQALGHVATGTEDHHGAGIGRSDLSPRRRPHCLRARRCPDRLIVRHGALLCGVLCRRMALRFFRLRFRIDELVTLDVAAEAETHRREHLFSEVVLPPRTESGVKRGRQHVRRDRLLDRGLDGPAALAGILDVAGELQLRILHQCGGAEIQQPG